MKKISLTITELQNNKIMVNVVTHNKNDVQQMSKIIEDHEMKSIMNSIIKTTKKQNQQEPDNRTHSYRSFWL